MGLQSIKRTIAAPWVLVGAMTMAFVDPSWGTATGIAALTLLPPLALLLLWNEPGQTLSESIREARR